MTPEQFKETMSRTLGGYGWKGRLGNLLGVRPSSITRWCDGTNPIPKWLAVLAVTLPHVPADMVETLIKARPIEEAVYDDDSASEE